MQRRRLIRLVVLCLILLALVGVTRFRHTPHPVPGPLPPTGFPEPAALRRVAASLQVLESREGQVAETVWAKELVAEPCGRVFESLWDAVNAASDKLGAIEALDLDALDVPRFNPPTTLAHDIQMYEPNGGGARWGLDQWRSFIREQRSRGWQLEQVEFRHNQFDPDASGQPLRSVFSFAAHLLNRQQSNRAAFAGDFTVEWGTNRTAEGLPSVSHIDASRLRLMTRQGDPPFRQVFCEAISPPAKSHFIDPLILYDLDGDGLSEIILAARNLVFHRRAWDRFEAQPLCQHSPGLIFTGVIADFDGDGMADFLCARFEGLVLFHGSPQGTFDEPGRLVWSATPHLKYAQVLTCGDIDGDGDLDVWLGQYKGPFLQGQMPTPYYDANDGNPSYLLLNDGRGNFTDATEAAGLSKKRWRRTYSASFVDLDGDGKLDLLVVSDFAGIDLYANDGRGHFTDVTEQWLPEHHAFGMAHTLADFNLDGRLDFLVTGMHCPTAQRLDHLGLSRPDHPDYAARRASMTTGNRLCLAQPDGRFAQTPLGQFIAHSGWSWGCSAFDFDNDGFPDVYIANGHESKQSVRDYEPEFWLHDIYVGTSRDDAVAAAYFGSKSSRTRGHGHSYGGYERNRLYLNRQGQSFAEIGYLMGVALEQDSRCVVTDDLDGDGRVDLLVTTFEAWPQAQQTLRIYQNTLADAGNWIGVKLRESGPGASPVGAQVTLQYAGVKTVRHVVTGDSHRAQHANTVHFGLGSAHHVDQLEVRWPNGRVTRLADPRVNTYHSVRLPGP